MVLSTPATTPELRVASRSTTLEAHHDRWDTSQSHANAAKQRHHKNIIHPRASPPPPPSISLSGVFVVLPLADAHLTSCGAGKHHVARPVRPRGCWRSSRLQAPVPTPGAHCWRRRLRLSFARAGSDMFWPPRLCGQAAAATAPPLLLLTSWMLAHCRVCQLPHDANHRDAGGARAATAGPGPHEMRGAFRAVAGAAGGTHGVGRRSRCPGPGHLATGRAPASWATARLPARQLAGTQQVCATASRLTLHLAAGATASRPTLHFSAPLFTVPIFSGFFTRPVPLSSPLPLLPPPLPPGTPRLGHDTQPSTPFTNGSHQHVGQQHQPVHSHAARR